MACAMTHLTPLVGMWPGLAATASDKGAMHTVNAVCVKELQHALKSSNLASHNEPLPIRKKENATCGLNVHQTHRARS